MFKTIKAKIQRDKDYPQRQFDIDVLTRVLDGEFYDHLQYDFNQEKQDGTQEYIPLRERRPSVRYGLCKTVVDDSVSLLFSEGHFPEIDCKDEKTREAIEGIIKEVMLNEVMIHAATIGSVGSVAILLRVLGGRVFFSVFNTQFLTPFWRSDAPDTLDKVVERYKTKGAELAAKGYAGIDDKADYWFQRDWNATQEVWYVPMKIGDDKAKLTIDAAKTTSHNLGFVPMVWVKNLPGGDDIDGKCTFPVEAIDTQIEIDYQLSQAGRGLKYSSDPTLLLKEPAMGNDGAMVKGGGNAIVVSENGDAKMLEINGTAAQAVIEYVRFLRELAMETAHGNRASADKLMAAPSGRAMELMNQSLIWLADKLRISYGEGALLDLLKMIVKASSKIELVTKDGDKIGELSSKEKITLRWPAWYAPSAQDRQNIAVTLKTHTDAGHMSRETAVKTIAADYDIEDVPKELATIGTEREAELARLAAQTEAKTSVSVEQ